MIATHPGLPKKGKQPQRRSGSPAIQSVGRPRGTTYPTNLRLFVQNTSEEAWVESDRVARTQPPMPRCALKTMTDADLRAIYQFVKGLGPKA
jgi:hypothetical protein